jgi:hypothetical protein
MALARKYSADPYNVTFMRRLLGNTTVLELNEVAES